MKYILKEIDKFFRTESTVAGIFAFGAFAFVVLIIIFVIL